MNPTASFVSGAHYTREHIHKELGGDLQSYLPHVDGRVVCACLTPKSNPDAPNVILVGTGERTEKYGKVLARQTEPIPVFVKDSPEAWEYRGLFEVQRTTTDIEIEARKADRDGDVSQVIYLRRADETLEDLYPNEVRPREG